MEICNLEDLLVSDRSEASGGLLVLIMSLEALLKWFALYVMYLFL